MLCLCVPRALCIAIIVQIVIVLVQCVVYVLYLVYTTVSAGYHMCKSHIVCALLPVQCAYVSPV